MSAGGIWAVCEIRQGELTRASLQLMGAAAKLADEKGCGAAAVLTGGSQDHAAQAAGFVPLVYSVEGAGLETYEAGAHLHALSKLIEEKGAPLVIMAGASAAGLEMMPALAARLGTGYASGCMNAQWNGDELVVSRPVYGGRAYEETAFTHQPAVFTVRPGAFAVPETSGGPGSVENISVQLPEGTGPKVVGHKSTTSGRKDVSEAAVVVSGGRGMESPDNFGMLEELADVLGGAVGVSRAVVDAEWRPHSEQVGKSGKTVSPGLYFAFGISGAIHHVLGMNTSKTVVAVNRDPDAIIFENADIGLIGNCFEVIPALTQALKTR